MTYVEIGMGPSGLPIRWVLSRARLDGLQFFLSWFTLTARWRSEVADLR